MLRAAVWGAIALILAIHAVILVVSAAQVGGLRVFLALAASQRVHLIRSLWISGLAMVFLGPTLVLIVGRMLYRGAAQLDDAVEATRELSRLLTKSLPLRGYV